MNKEFHATLKFVYKKFLGSINFKSMLIKSQIDK